jgi:hypothetical protein
MPHEEGVLHFAATLLANTMVLIGSVLSAVCVRAKKDFAKQHRC